MRLSNKQALILYDLLKTIVTDGNYHGFAGYKRAFLLKFVEDILNQQSNKIVELDELKSIIDKG